MTWETFPQKLEHEWKKYFDPECVFCVDIDSRICCPRHTKTLSDMGAKVLQTGESARQTIRPVKNFSHCIGHYIIGRLSQWSCNLPEGLTAIIGKADPGAPVWRLSAYILRRMQLRPPGNRVLSNFTTQTGKPHQSGKARSLGYYDALAH